VPKADLKLKATLNFKNGSAGWCILDKLKINLTSCYGIQSLQDEFDFSTNAKFKPRAYAIYAPNGVMKTSFAKTFEDLSKGATSKEERYNRISTCIVESDGTNIDKKAIYVLKSEIDISADSPSITNILVDSKNKSRYDKLLVDLDKLKNKLIKNLNKSSGVKPAEIEDTILKDWGEDSFPVCIEKISKFSPAEDLSLYTYNTIFDPKALEILNSKEFLSKAEEFNHRYQKIFEESGSLYHKGIFNPNRAETSFNTLDKQGFFAVGHRIHLKGENNAIGKEELDERLKAIHVRIEEDSDLKKIKTNLAKNAQTQALADLIEALSTSQFEFLLINIKPEYQRQFRKNLWIFYVNDLTEAALYIDTYSGSKEEIESIEIEASKSAPRWEKAVELFNSRFVDMPFTLSVMDQAKAVLGRKKQAQLKFTFKDGVDSKECFREEVKATLSQGERRALYLLNFIFDVEERIMNNSETLFILDDVADSFDYKNKHAIIQYLRDLSEIDFFHQIILTHNFDFFRAISQGNGGFIHRSRCLMTSRDSGGISLSVAEGVSNYFVNVWKPALMKCNRVLYATIPFTRNLIEYTQDYINLPLPKKDYLMLTSLLHWKSDTDQISVGNYLEIYNKVFHTSHDTSSAENVIDLLDIEAKKICAQTAHKGLNLEDKVLLCIATRIEAEKFLISKLRNIKNDKNYWYEGTSDQFRWLLEEYKQLQNAPADIRTLEKVGITVNSNIHLNSFMYEPILDLTIDHLIALYKEVSKLNYTT
jgi:hypothetical protein